MTNGYVTNEQLLEQLRWRYAVKRFDPEKRISEQDWKTLEQVLLLAPSSYGLQPWKFYVVTDPEMKAELRAYSYDQPQIVECSHLVVISALKDADAGDIERLLNRIMEVRGTPPEELEILKDMMHGSQKAARESGELNNWSAKQCFIALGFLLSAAALRGIDACPMEGFKPEKYDEVLGIDADGYFSVVACALGFRDKENDWLGSLEKVRFDESEVFKKI